jgi:hypothetical protein
MSSCNDQPSSINFATNNGFQFSLKNAPLLNFFCTKAEIPAISLMTSSLATRYNTVPLPGEEVRYEELTIEFKIDENYKNYWHIHTWLRASGNALSLQELYDMQESVNDSTSYTGTVKESSIYSDGFLYLLDSGGKRNKTIVFYDMFPVGIGSVSYDTQVSEVTPLSVNATFKYTYYDFV